MTKSDFELFEKTVDQQRELLGKYFKEVVSAGTIVKYTESKPSVEIKEKKYTFHFRAVIGMEDSYTVDLFFTIEIESKEKRIHVISNARKATFYLPFAFKSQELTTKINDKLYRWRMGQKNEYLFQEFLKDLCERHPKKIMSVHKASKEADMYYGIDFIVSFVDERFGKVWKVAFNLKSSQKYLQRHKERYPTVSTFSFKKIDFKDSDALKERFFSFMEASRNAVVHF